MTNNAVVAGGKSLSPCDLRRILFSMASVHIIKRFRQIQTFRIFCTYTFLVDCALWKNVPCLIGVEVALGRGLATCCYGSTYDCVYESCRPSPVGGGCKRIA